MEERSASVLIQNVTPGLSPPPSSTPLHPGSRWPGHCGMPMRPTAGRVGRSPQRGMSASYRFPTPPGRHRHA